MDVGLLLTMASTATTRYSSAQCATQTHLAPNDNLPPVGEITNGQSLSIIQKLRNNMQVGIHSPKWNAFLSHLPAQ